MINEDELDGIRFRPDDQPPLPETDLEAMRAEREAERRRMEENLRWLERHCPWRPFCEEW
jgi:hypothetical protein